MWIFLIYITNYSDYIFLSPSLVFVLCYIQFMNLILKLYADKLYLCFTNLHLNFEEIEMTINEKSKKLTIA